MKKFIAASCMIALAAGGLSAAQAPSLAMKTPLTQISEGQPMRLT